MVEGRPALGDLGRLLAAARAAGASDQALAAAACSALAERFRVRPDQLDSELVAKFVEHWRTVDGATGAKGSLELVGFLIAALTTDNSAADDHILLRALFEMREQMRARRVLS